MDTRALKGYQTAKTSLPFSPSSLYLFPFLSTYLLRMKSIMSYVEKNGEGKIEKFKMVGKKEGMMFTDGRVAERKVCN